MQYEIEYQCYSHIGRVRQMNQDNFICLGSYLNEEQSGVRFPLTGRVKPGPETVLGVFDGMGGEECGEVASFLAAECARDLRVGENPPEDLLRFCMEANERICEYADSHGVRFMGTTAAILAFSENQIGLCNIGDSRIFRYSGGQMEQISVDHVGAAPYGRKAPLSRNLGIPPAEMVIEPYVAVGDYHPEDKYLICSDGLTDMIEPDKLEKILRKAPFPLAGRILMKTALDNGGRDNVTLILCEIRKRKNGLFRLFQKD